jgi:glycolate oxidase FAD binding subunit
MQPTSIQELQDAVKQHPLVRVRGGGTKPTLSTPREGETSIDLTAIAGMLEYEPGEFVFTALAGTRVAEVQAQLAAHGQYLPFDPLFVDQGATLGGTVASGANGPGRYRYGGVRDFLLGVKFINGQGEIVRAGGKVVKNSAGFDIPKLMVGSLGQYGALIELSFKVFPKPEAYTTLRLECSTLDAAIDVIQRLYTSPLEIDSFDLEIADRPIIWLRLAGLRSALPARIDRVRNVIGGGDVIAGDEVLWSDVRKVTWQPKDWMLIKVPITPKRIPAFEQTLPAGIMRRYSSGGQVAWLATPDQPAQFDRILCDQGLSGLVMIGPADQARLGVRRGDSFARRVKSALDPNQRFVEV